MCAIARPFRYARPTTVADSLRALCYRDLAMNGHRGAGRRTIAMLVDWINDGYQNLILSGVVDAAAELDVNVLCLAGGVLDAPVRFGAQRNVIYDFVRPGRVDGVILLSGTLGNAIGPAALGRACERWKPLPMVSIAVPLGGVPAIVVDDADGMREGIRHLIDVHGYRRIVFVRGPEANEEAQGRYAAYRHVLEERRIPFDPALVAPGDFQAEAGANAVATMLDDRHVGFQAIVAANDHMALGAMQALHDRQIPVPEKVAVIGFDDVDEARFATPPLTTVRQPLYQQGQRALRLVVAALEGARATGQVEMKTDLVIRESCGCSSGRVQFRQREVERQIGEGIEAWLGTHRDLAAGAMSHAVRSAGSAALAGWEERLLDAFLGDVLRRTHGQ